jgi:hypothetical protein
MGGLAVACFTKLYGIVFLGQNRSGLANRRQNESSLSSVTLLGLAGLCGLLGFVPLTGLRLVAPALRDLSAAAGAPTQWASPLGQLQLVFTLFLALIVVLYAVKVWVQARTRVRLGETWGCGYPEVTPRMQYTASGFAAELVELGRPMLASNVQWRPLQGLLPLARVFHSNCQDRMENGWLLLNRGIERLVGALRWIQSGNIRHYVLYVFAAVVFYLFCAIIW